MKTVHEDIEVCVSARLWIRQRIGQGDFLLENGFQLPLYRVHRKWLLVFLAIRNQKITGYRTTTPYHDGPHEGRAANKKQEDGAGEHLHHAATATLRVFLGKSVGLLRCDGAAPPCGRTLPRDAYR